MNKYGMFETNSNKYGFILQISIKPNAIALKDYKKNICHKK